MDNLNKVIENEPVVVEQEVAPGTEEFKLILKLPTGSLSQELKNSKGTFKEVIEPGTFIKAVSKAINLQILINHDYRKVITKDKKDIDIKETANNLIVEVQLDKENPQHQELYKKAQEGLFEGVSFGFRAIKEQWNEDRTLRIVKEIELKEISILTEGVKPAYLQSSVEFRSLKDEKEYINMTVEVQGTTKIIKGENVNQKEKLNFLDVVIKSDKLGFLKYIKKEKIKTGKAIGITIGTECDVFNQNRIIESFNDELNLDISSLSTIYASVKYKKSDVIYDLPIETNESRLNKLMANSLFIALLNTVNEYITKTVPIDIKNHLVDLVNNVPYRHINNSLKIFVSEKDFKVLWGAVNSNNEELLKLIDGVIYFRSIEVIAHKDIKVPFILNLDEITFSHQNYTGETKKIVNSENARTGVIELVKEIKGKFKIDDITALIF